MSLRRVARLEARLQQKVTRQNQRTYYVVRDENTSDDAAIEAAGITPHDDDLVVLLIHFGSPTPPRLLRVD